MSVGGGEGGGQGGECGSGAHSIPSRVASSSAASMSASQTSVSLSLSSSVLGWAAAPLPFSAVFEYAPAGRLASSVGGAAAGTASCTMTGPACVCAMFARRWEYPVRPLQSDRQLVCCCLFAAVEWPLLFICALVRSRQGPFTGALAKQGSARITCGAILQGSWTHGLHRLFALAVYYRSRSRKRAQPTHPFWMRRRLLLAWYPGTKRFFLLRAVSMPADLSAPIRSALMHARFMQAEVAGAIIYYLPHYAVYTSSL